MNIKKLPNESLTKKYICYNVIRAMRIDYTKIIYIQPVRFKNKFSINLHLCDGNIQDNYLLLINLRIALLYTSFIRSQFNRIIQLSGEESYMYNGTVFNELQELSFLSIAANECLISERGISDGLFDKIKNSMPSYPLAQKLLERFCVAGKVYINPSIFRFLEGELIDREIIVPYSKERNKKHELSLEDLVLDPYSIQQFLKEKNYDTSQYSIERLTWEFEEWKKKAKELLNFYDNHPDYQTDWFSVFLGLPCDTLTKKEKDYYTNLEHEVLNSIVYTATHEYLSLVEIAYHNNLLCPVTISTEHNQSKNYSANNQNTLLESQKAVRISKYTSNVLGRIYVAGSLKDCISLTQSDAARAYRQKINEFVTSLSKQEYNNIERINEEISKAQSAMKWESRYKKTIEITGRIVATAGAIGQAVSQISPDPLVVAVGSGISIFATYISVPLAFFNPIKQDSYLWANYGLFY